MSEEKISFLPPEALQAKFVIGALSETTDWGLLASGIPDAHKHTRGEGITVAVLDTGTPKHLDLTGNVLSGVNCTDTASDEDFAGHGCIKGEEKIWTSEHGVSTIEQIYNESTADSIIVSGKDNSCVKILNSSNIKTIARFNDGKIGFSKIKAVHKLQVDETIVKIKTKNTELSLTPWHPVYVVESNQAVVKKRADELSIGDSVCTSKFFEDQLPYINMPFDACVYKECGSKQDKISINHVVLNENFGQWLGLVVSNGNLIRNSSTLEFCADNQDLIERFEYLTKEIFELHCIRCEKNKLKTKIHSINLTACLYESFGLSGGSQSITLKLPKLIEKSRISVIGAFIAGIMEANKCVESNGWIKIGFDSKDFIYSLRDLLRMRGVDAVIDNTGAILNLRVSSHSCILNHLPSDLLINFTLTNTDLTSEAILEITQENYIGDMYDLTVDGTSNYIANSLVVSNTHVSGIISALENGVGVIGVAPDSKILPIKVLDDSGRSGFTQIAKGIRAAIDAKVDIINMSLGAPSTPPDDFHTVIKEAFNAGIIMVAAAGNDSGAVNWPARYDEVIAVSAIDNQGNLANFSSRGEQIDFGAPGVNIYSTYLKNQYSILNGTSQASPFIAGVCALLLAWTRKNSQLPQIKNSQDMLLALSKFTDKNGRLTDGKFGMGIPKFANAFEEQPETSKSEVDNTNNDINPF
jgi:subtilisin family serine protease